MEECCLFKAKYGHECNDEGRLSQNKDDARIFKIISYSRAYGDGIHIDLERSFSATKEKNEKFKVSYHLGCVSRYVSPRNYQPSDDETFRDPPAKKLRKSSEHFNFKEHCLYCGKDCDTIRSQKNPQRWEEAYLCRSTHIDKKKTYVEYLLEKCKERNYDEYALNVQARIEHVGDLVAVEARYHKKCLSLFLSLRNIGSNERITSSDPDSALQALYNVVESNKDKLWNSIELAKLYNDLGGQQISKGWLVSKLKERFHDDIVVLTANGYASVVAFNGVAAITLKLVKDNSSNDVEKALNKVAAEITKECASIPQDRTNYHSHIDKSIAQESVPSTLASLLSRISPELQDSLPSILIGNIISSIVNRHVTPLQIGLGLLLDESKALLSHFHDYQVTCSHDEVLRLKKSAAAASPKIGDVQDHRVSCAGDGLMQIVVDNFDATLSTQNCKQSTHSLAMIVTQPLSSKKLSREHETIPRLKKAEMPSTIIGEIEPEKHHAKISEKKATMPKVPTPSVPEEFLNMQNASKQRMDEVNFDFMRDVTTLPLTPEYNGYCTKILREEEQNIKPKTNVVYLLLINQSPTDPRTIVTSLYKARTISQSAGQTYVIFNADQQLYKIALNIIWQNPEFSDIIPRLGGMHLLMSYVGCIGKLMEDTGLSEILSSIFGGVEAMLIGKKYPQNIRALRLIVEEILRPIFQEQQPETAKELWQCLDQKAEMSRTSKLWIECLIKPVFLIGSYVSAERESNWPLHLLCVSEMLPLFYAAGHFNYARYAAYYLHSMESLPEEILERFLAGEHTMHHQSGIRNGIWSDMAIETTYMRYGHGKRGIIGITQKPDTLNIWAYSRHACNVLLNDMDGMRGEETSAVMYHKEESKQRVTNDEKDRKGLREKLKITLSPLDPDSHPESHLKAFINVVTGQVLDAPSINVDNAVTIGTNQMREFTASWPSGFHEPLSKKVYTLATTHTSTKSAKAWDAEVMYARAMTARSAVDDKTLLSYEMAPHPTSLFEDNGQLREAKNKSVLKNALKVEVSECSIDDDIEAQFIDGCAVLWVIPWPTTGHVQDFLDGFRRYIFSLAVMSKTYLIFDRYDRTSAKESSRQSRAKGACYVFKLSPTTPLPPKKALLLVSANKLQLIDLICKDLIEHRDDLSNPLIITGGVPVPTEVSQDGILEREDLTTYQEEADTIIIHQLAESNVECALVMADDTDIFILLMHHIHHEHITGQIYMKSPVNGGALLHVNCSVANNLEIMPDLLAMHALTGCDYVGPYHGVGKSTALNILRNAKYSLDKIGNLQIPISEVVNQATSYILACYGKPGGSSMTEARFQIWSAKITGNTTVAPKLKTLPPTNEGFQENVARAHLTVATWLNALNEKPLDVDYTAFGFMQVGESILPRPLPPGTLAFPQELLKITKCGCKTSKACSTLKCTCHSASLRCSTFCGCCALEACYNPHTIRDRQPNP